MQRELYTMKPHNFGKNVSMDAQNLLFPIVVTEMNV